MKHPFLPAKSYIDLQDRVCPTVAERNFVPKNEAYTWVVIKKNSRTGLYV
jgi:hypothetical protein